MSSSWSPRLVQHCLDACEGGHAAVLFSIPAAPNAEGVSCAMLDDMASLGGRDEDEVAVVVVV